MVDETGEVVVLDKVSEELSEGVSRRKDEERVTLLGVFFHVSRHVLVLAEL